jgi:hypothetical protein
MTSTYGVWPGYSAWVLIAVFSVVDCRRDPPPGSGDVETTPTSKTNASGAFRSDETPQRKIANFPGGAALVADPAQCSVSMLDGEQGVRWHAALPRCGGIADLVVAHDSTAYVRTLMGLHAFSIDGGERWRIAVGANPVPRSIFAPAVTPDSAIVVASSTRVVVAFRPDGQEQFRFQLPDDETLIAPPVGNATEGVLLLTSQAVYALGAEGQVRWRKATGPSPPG